jgi:hypothetical protein
LRVAVSHESSPDGPQYMEWTFAGCDHDHDGLMVIVLLDINCDNFSAHTHDNKLRDALDDLLLPAKCVRRCPN